MLMYMTVFVFICVCKLLHILARANTYVALFKNLVLEKNYGLSFGTYVAQINRVWAKPLVK